ncbi:pro-MCH [Hemitrygon akajei]|uniref:pro-MCH n=1 Tax=Hemitrygon akajei TaxID=2704970 RepID=UPI003BF95B25
MEQPEESSVPQRGFGREMVVPVGNLLKNGRSSDSFNTDQRLQPGQVDPNHVTIPDLSFKMYPETFEQPFEFQKFLKPPLVLRLMKGPPDFLAKRTESSHLSNQAELSDLPEVHREHGDEENGVVFPMGRRNFDVLRCMLGRVYRPCWQN